MTQQLSPAAQAVLDAFDAKQDEMHKVTWLTRNPDRDCLAAALRAAADQVVPEEPLYYGDMCWEFKRDERQHCRQELLCIANELEAQ